MRKRSTPLRRTPFNAPAKASTKVSQAKCKNCRAPFVKFDMRVKWCSPECGAVIAGRLLAEEARRAAIEDRKKTRAQLEAMKKLGTLRAEAQEQFNRFVRLRDKAAGYGCICCGEPLEWNSTKPGGAVDAGHFVSRGSSPELAFDERNVNAQRKGCNRPGGTTRAKFTAGMLARYGADVVAELEGPNELPHLKHDDYRQIRDTYRRKARELEKA